jgi:transcription initiation factor TFIIIB Brf1 subunit/transcription initiation factor TFIIB
VIRMAEAKRVAEALRARYEPVRAVVLIARILEKALFAGRSDEVVFWALVYAHYRGGKLCGTTEAELAAFRDSLLADPEDLQ